MTTLGLGRFTKKNIMKLWDYETVWITYRQ